MDVAVIDDKEDNRESLCDELESPDLTPRPIEGTFHTPEELLRVVLNTAEAAICDHHLKDGNYAAFFGTEFVKECYEKKVPAILQTRWSIQEIYDIRRYRRWIPVLLRTDDVNLDSVIRSVEVVKKEFEGSWSVGRRAWRTLLRVEAVIEEVVHVSLVGWSSKDVVGVPLDLIENDKIRTAIKREEVTRLYAHVNKGAEDQAELYFCDFELRGVGEV